MDIARWILGEPALSPAVLSVGGRFGYVDDGTTPNTQIVLHAYATAPLIFEVRGLPHSNQVEKMDNYRGAGVGVIVDCEDGYVVIPSYDSATVYNKAGEQVRKFSGNASHYANFVNAVRSRKYQDLNADIEEGHLSSALCHTGNISYRLGQNRSPDEVRESLKDDSAMAESFARMAEHLVQNNGVDLTKTPLKLGVHLKMNPETERFIGHETANEMLTRRYREPYVVPNRV